MLGAPGLGGMPGLVGVPGQLVGVPGLVGMPDWIGLAASLREPNLHLLFFCCSTCKVLLLTS